VKRTAAETAGAFVSESLHIYCAGEKRIASDGPIEVAKIDRAPVQV
jgi:hypothetical protein